MCTSKSKPFYRRDRRARREISVHSFSLRPRRTRRLNAFAFALLLLLFLRQRSVHLEQAFGQIHLDALVLRDQPAPEIPAHTESRNSFFPDPTTSSGASPAPKRTSLTRSNFAIPIKQHATDQIADVNRARFQFGAFTGWNLQLAAYQNFRVRNRLDACELQNQPIFCGQASSICNSRRLLSSASAKYLQSRRAAVPEYRCGSRTATSPWRPCVFITRAKSDELILPSLRDSRSL